MSSERLKKLAERISLAARIGYILTVVSLFLQTVSLMWLTIMPNKFIKFFDKIRIYEPFITDIKNDELTLFELSSAIISTVFLFIILKNIEKIFQLVATEFSLSKVAINIKVLSFCFLGEALTVPVMKIVSYSVFVKSNTPTGMIDLSALVVAGVLWYIGQVIQTKAVEKSNGM